MSFSVARVKLTVCFFTPSLVTICVHSVCSLLFQLSKPEICCGSGVFNCMKKENILCPLSYLRCTFLLNID